jgi:DNA-directed RNA polymerase subunit K/omega
LVVLAAKRARQLKDGAPPLVEVTSPNVLTTALAEIAASKIGIIEVPEEPDDEAPGYVQSGFTTSGYDDFLPDSDGASGDDAESEEVDATPSSIDSTNSTAELKNEPAEE